MFAERQLLALSTLLQGIMTEKNETLKEMLLCAFSNTLEGNNLFVRNIPSRRTPGGTAPAGVFARHDFQSKATACEQNVWGTVSGNNTFISRIESLGHGLSYAKTWSEDGKQIIDPLPFKPKLTLSAIGAAEAIPQIGVPISHFVTDPPYGGNVNYAELSDFFYVWLRLGLKDVYQEFAPEFSPKANEIVENSTRGKTRMEFYKGLSAVFAHVHSKVPDDGLLVFTFHHTDQEGTVWEGLLQSLCDTGFEIVAVYPIHAEREASLHLMDKENVSYDSNPCLPQAS
jgi:adenine-specific DNA methylase